MKAADNNLVEVLGGLSDRERRAVEAHIRRGVKTAESSRLPRRIRARLKRKARMDKGEGAPMPPCPSGMSGIVTVPSQKIFNPGV